jgi:hypothetical protein
MSLTMSTLTRRRAERLCPRCGNLPPLFGHKHCVSCLEHWRQRRRDKKRQRQCVNCSRPSAPGRTLCLQHLARHRQKVASYRCVHCAEDGGQCAPCRNARNARRRARYLQRTKALACVRCGRPALATRPLCALHARKQQHIQRRYDLKRRAGSRRQLLIWYVCILLCFPPIVRRSPYGMKWIRRERTLA